MFSIFKSKASSAKKNNNDAPKNQSSMKVLPDIQTIEVLGYNQKQVAESTKSESEISTLNINSKIIKDSNNVSDLGSKETGPVKPILDAYPMTVAGKQNRSFSAKYLKEYSWLEYSLEKNAAFCFCCRNFGCGDVDKVFTKTGFTNWKKMGGANSNISKLKAHAATKEHMLNISRMSGYKNSVVAGSVSSQISIAHQQFVENNRNYLKKLINIALFLARQGIAFRGHKEDTNSPNQGNFIEMCKLFSNHNPEFKTLFNCSINYTSPLIQNELISLCANNVQSMIMSEVKDAGCFSIMCDEARCHKQEQMSICIRYTKDFEILERFLGFVNVSQSQTAASLLSFILSFLKELNLDNIPIVAQSYDGASVMSGCRGGVQTLLKKYHPSAVYIHCMAHRLNLVVVDMCKNVKYSKNVFNALEAIYIHFSMPTMNKKLQDMQVKLKMNLVTLSSISDTRWVCRHKNCKAVIENFKLIVDVLQEEVEENNDRDVSRAIGILAMMLKGEFVVYLHIMNYVLSIIQILSCKLQMKNETLGKAANTVIGVIKTFEDSRNSESFSNLWEEIENFSIENCIDLQIPTRLSKRKRREVTQLNDYVVSTTTSAIDQNFEQNSEITSIDFWKVHAFFPILDNLIVNMKSRFSTQSLELAQSVESFLELDYEKSSYFINSYKSLFNIDEDALKCELKVAKRCLINAQNSDKSISGMNVEEKTQSQLLKSVVQQEVYPNVYLLLKTAFAIPISSATCERSFSCMRRIKSYIRSTMTQNRFSDLAILNIERELSNVINDDDILKLFSSKYRRIQL